ncbi:MAG: transcription termination/antitermination protein NusG [Oscillospiraceae bacterium]|jgi:transcriptional antiterminator NusG|nr:transcription termination/antitermination protein NusG [Oscillospiraceae bacterium]
MERDARWYVIHTYSGYENKVAANIEKIVENRGMQDQIFGVNIPTETVVEITEGGKRKEVERKLYPGYVFVKIAVGMDNDDMPKISDESWFVVRNIRGVTGFVGPDNRPAPLDEDKVIEMGVESRRVEVSYRVGDMVNIVHPSFEGFTGRVESINLEQNTVKIAITALFGKETITELAMDWVEPLE